MKITLISPYEDIYSYGIRVLSAYLKKYNQDVQIIFLIKGKHQEYNSEIFNDLAEICKDSGLIGISMMTNHFSQAVSITEGLRMKLNIPIVWGGVHPTIRPDECLKHADIVCIGEGEIPLLELAERMDRGEDCFDIKSLWFRDKERAIKNQMGTRIENLDTIPSPDYDGTNDYILRGGKLHKLDKALLKEYLTQVRGISLNKRAKFFSVLARMLQPRALIEQQAVRNRPKYLTLTSRGCPHNCAYCGNNALKRIHGSKYLRWKSIESIIDELSEVKEKMEYISFVNFLDDNFFGRKTEDIKKFSQLYKEKINLPFACTVSPTTITEEKMNYLIDAGLCSLKMGIQSGSQKTLKLYKRPMSAERVKNAASIINKYKSIVPSYDIITDNPYESEDDEMQTLHLLRDLPRPFLVQTFSCTFLPGTELYDIAKKDGRINDEKKEIYDKMFERDKKRNHFNFILGLFSFNVPKVIMRILTNRMVCKFLGTAILNPVYNITLGFNRYMKREKG